MNDQNPLYLVHTTLEDEAQARKLARRLVDAHLVACAHIHPPCESVFPWEGRIETAREVVLTLKTSQARWPSVKAWLNEHHPYDVPEVLAMPICDGLPDYLRWADAWLSHQTGDLPQ